MKSVKLEVGQPYVMHETDAGELYECPRHAGKPCAVCDRQEREGPRFTTTVP